MPASDERPAISAAITASEGRVLMVQRLVKEGELSWQFPVDCCRVFVCRGLP